MRETGIIRSVREVPHPVGAPHRYLALTASVADARMLGEWPADRVSLGTSFGDPAQARIAAIGEGVERYCGNWLPDVLPRDELRVATAQELRAEGESVIDEDDLPRFADWQLTRPGFPYQRLLPSTPTLWARCEDLDGGSVWMPDALVHLNWRQSRFRSLPRTHHLNYAGIATGAGFRRRPRPRGDRGDRAGCARGVVAPRRADVSASTRPRSPVFSTICEAAACACGWWRCPRSSPRRSARSCTTRSAGSTPPASRPRSIRHARRGRRCSKPCTPGSTRRAARPRTDGCSVRSPRG